MGGGVGGGSVGIHGDVRQKPSRYCKAVILQSKINTLLKKGRLQKSTCDVVLFRTESRSAEEPAQGRPSSVAAELVSKEWD